MKDTMSAPEAVWCRPAISAWNTTGINVERFARISYPSRVRLQYVNINSTFL